MRALTILLPLLAATASAYTVPFEGWSEKDASTWTADSGVCILREQKHDSEFPLLGSVEDAGKFAAKLQKSLFAQKLGAVVTQPVERAGQWGVLASYEFVTDGKPYAVTQLYLSEQGKLRTFTGSSPQGQSDQCVLDMRSFVRYMAN